MSNHSVWYWGPYSIKRVYIWRIYAVLNLQLYWRPSFESSNLLLVNRYQSAYEFSLQKRELTQIFSAKLPLTSAHIQMDGSSVGVPVHVCCTYIYEWDAIYTSIYVYYIVLYIWQGLRVCTLASQTYGNEAQFAEYISSKDQLIIQRFWARVWCCCCWWCALTFRALNLKEYKVMKLWMFFFIIFNLVILGNESNFFIVLICIAHILSAQWQNQNLCVI